MHPALEQLPRKTFVFLFMSGAKVCNLLDKNKNIVKNCIHITNTNKDFYILILLMYVY